jgi:hypothetical protein
VAAAGDDHIVLQPLQNGTSAPERMMVFIPGGKVPNAHYIATARAIQQFVGSDLRLWVVIPAVFQRLCIISCASTSICSPLNSAVDEALAQAADRGWSRGKDKPWLAGHSLGGVCANTLFQAYSTPSSTPYAGIVVMGSYVDEAGAYDLTNYPNPVLMLNTELDGGLARPGKTAIWWRQYEALVDGKGEESMQKAVVVLPKLNHSDFCPGFDVPGDLLAEVDQATATSTIGASVAAFLRIHVASSEAAKVPSDAVALLQEHIDWTRQFMTPYLKAQELERSSSDNTASGKWCSEAQLQISGLASPYRARVSVLDSFHNAASNLEHCHPNWTTTSDGLLVRSCSHADYYLDVDNTGEITAASEIACKMLSSARIAQQMNVTAADPNVDCSAVNRRAVQLAERMAAPSTLQRYRRSGKGWCFLEDHETFGDVGPLWVFKDSLQLTENATCMGVSSASLKSSLTSPIFPGSHYCKLLSPARVLDWMMTDSLKHSAATARVDNSNTQQRSVFFA